MPVVFIHEEGKRLTVSTLNAFYDLDIIHETLPLRTLLLKSLYQYAEDRKRFLNCSY